MKTNSTLEIYFNVNFISNIAIMLLRRSGLVSMHAYALRVLSSSPIIEMLSKLQRHDLLSIPLKT